MKFSLVNLLMPSDHQNKEDTVLTEHLQDQFVAWFVGVMAVVYVVEHLYKSRQTENSDKS